MKPIERFFNFIQKDPERGCWIWQGSGDSDGYGHFYGGTKEEKIFRAHRWSYSFFRKKIPETLMVLHRCHEPMCVNPAHLDLGNHESNMKDKYAKANGGYHKLTVEQVKEIRVLRAHGMSRVRVAEKMGVNPKTILEIDKGLTWKWVK